MGFELFVKVDIANFDPEVDDPLDTATNIISNTGGSIISVDTVGNNFLPLTVFYRTEEEARLARNLLIKSPIIFSVSEPRSSIGKLTTSVLNVLEASPEEGFAENRFTPEENIDMLRLKRVRDIERIHGGSRGI